ENGLRPLKGPDAVDKMTDLMVHEAEVVVGQGQPARGLDVIRRGVVSVLQRIDGLSREGLRGRVSTSTELSNVVHIVAAAEQAKVLGVLGVGSDQGLHQANGWWMVQMHDIVQARGVAEAVRILELDEAPDELDP